MKLDLAVVYVIFGWYRVFVFIFFFFQAEDGIRDRDVTGVQTCALPICVLEPLTGALAGEGKRHLEGYEIVRDLINERGGVMGKKLVFVVADAPDPTAAASEANRLITREGVKIITGTFSSRLCGAASEAAARHDVIYWETSCVDPRFNKRGL